MIRFERTFNGDLIAEIMRHPRLYPSLSDDFYPSPENFLPMDNPAIRYLVVFDGQELLGLYITHPINNVLWEVHHALLPNAWGRRALAIGEAFGVWLWSNTDCQTLIGFTDAENKLAVRYAEKLGMQRVGIIHRAVQRQFQLRDVIVFQKQRT